MFGGNKMDLFKRCAVRKIEQCYIKWNIKNEFWLEYGKDIDDKQINEVVIEI